MPVTLFLQRFHGTDDMPDTSFFTERFFLFQFPFRDGGVFGGDGDHMISKRLVRDGKQKRGIHTAGKADRNGTERLKVCLQCLPFFHQFI